ncbi:MAG: sugar phosphate isomerase/epimerase [Anaerolineales bacterium]|jgi:sugar phosphate isomerase/epimerase|nr:sugar phosphate isomerase/epimerase [Anaerolineales bacterium]
MAKHPSIKRGVSLYSLQEEYFHRKMTLADILAACSKLDIRGIEIIGDQMIPRYPDISEDFFKAWHGWMERFELTPVCLDMFLDWNKYKGRVMTFDERVESVTRDIINANRLGCTVIRMIHDIEPDLLEKLAPVAEKYKVTLALEVHAPSDLDSPLEQRLIQLFDRLQTPYLGFTIDLGIYCKRLPRVVTERYLREGMAPALAQWLTDAYDHQQLPHAEDEGPGKESLAEMVLKRGGREWDIYLAYMGTHMIYSNPRRLLDFMPHIKHFHGKFYEMLPDCTEYSIPYADIIPVLQEGGFSGYIDSEYEGNRWIHDAFEVDSAEQLRRHHVLLKQLLGEA